MALKLPYKFALVMYGEDGTNIGTVLTGHDWAPAMEWTRFYFQRRGELRLDGDCNATVIPLWQREYGEPYCRAFRMEIERPGLRPVASEFPITCFQESASAAASAYVASGKLRAGEYYRYMAVAYLARPEAPTGKGILVTDATPAPAVQEGSLEEFLKRSRAVGEIDSDDMPVFVSQRVLDEAVEKTLCEEGIETGGILVGTLLRDSVTGEIFTSITAQIPAEHTIANEVKLTLSSKTWAAADAALKIRGRGEAFHGYWHSHPYRTWMSKASSAEGTRWGEAGRDSAVVEFFSVDDETVMRAIFPRAWCVGIVATDTNDGVKTSMYGLRGGITQSRGFYVLDEEKTDGA